MHSRGSTESNGGASARDTPSWDGILTVLLDELPELARDFVAEYMATEPYPSDLVSDDDIAATAEQTLSLLVHRLRGDPDPVATVGVIERLGARRARQGIAQSRLLRAARLDFRVIWVRLQRIAGAEGSVVLAANVTRLLDTVDRYIDELRDAHRLESARRDRYTATRRHSAILSLFSADASSEIDAGSVAARLRMRPAARYEVAVVVGDGIEALAQQYGGDEGVGVYERVEALILFREQSQARGWIAELAGVRGGYVGEVPGLAAVPSAARVAAEIARSASGEARGLATQEDVWLTIARARLDAALPRFCAAVTEPLEALPAHERERLVEAVRAYMRLGSVKETAAELYCHRNTVINRLRAFEAATGFDPTIPADAAWILVAFAPALDAARGR